MSSVPRPGTPAPDLALPGPDGRPVRLADYRGKNVVLAFYPADWSPVCTNELAELQERLGDLRRLGAEVVAVSVDNVYSHRAWAKHQGLGFPLLADFWPHGEAARRYGVFREADGISERALFFIDGQGVVRETWVAEHPGIAPEIDFVFAALEKLRAAPGG